MKTVILAGGLGTRISEESHLKPKPMIEIGGKPILWHIMKIYSHYGFNGFVICCGYKQNVIKEYFANYFLHNSDITFDYSHGGNEITVHGDHLEHWKVTLVDTGLHTMTGGRIKRIRPYVGEEPFFLTYGDGLADVDLPALLEFHQQSGAKMTLTCAQPASRFGIIDIGEGGAVTSFREKHAEDSAWVNAGFMVVAPEIIDLIEDDTTVFEQYPLEEASRRGELYAYKHPGFWQCMDTLREKEKLEELWTSGQAPWKLWEA